MGNFYKSIDENLKLIQQEINQALLQEVQTTFTDVVNETPSKVIGAPYSQDYLANQWYVSEGAPSTSISSEKSSTAAGSRSRIDSISSWKTFFKKDGSVFLTNNVDYVMNAEEYGWMPDENPRWLGAKPYAMVENAIIKAKGRNQ